MQDITKAALDKWGIDSQVRMLTEECAELIQVLSHFNRGRCGLNRVCEEIVDVEITLDSVRQWIEDTEPEMLTLVRDIKLDRLKNLLTKETK